MAFGPPPSREIVCDRDSGTISINGKVYDPNGATVAGATVTISGHYAITTSTDSLGRWSWSRAGTFPTFGVTIYAVGSKVGYVNSDTHSYLLCPDSPYDGADLT